MKKRVLSLILSAVMLISVIAIFSGCSSAPEYGEIEERFKWLVENSHEVNVLIFGEGLPTDQRVYSPWNNMETYELRDENGEVIISSLGKPKLGYYCYAEDAEYGKILAYRNGATAETVYLEVSESPRDGVTEVYFNSEKGYYYYATDYEFPDIRYYTNTDPEHYDYVSDSSEIKSIDEIKQAAEKVYSKNYLESSVYESLFTGVMVDESTSGTEAKYIEYSDLNNSGVTSLMQSNVYPVLVTEKRIFDFSTAKVVKPGNKSTVNIEVETYLESNPQNRVVVRVTLVLQDGEWFLDSGTY